MSRIVKAVLLLFAVYFPIAIYLKLTYVSQPQQSARRIWLSGPFISAGGAAYLAELPRFHHLGDSNDQPFQSPLTLYEDEKPIGPPHSEVEEIKMRGQGRYSHWKDLGIVFSTTDNSDPNQNWKRYSIKIEPSPQKIWLTGLFIHLDGAAYVAALPKLDHIADSVDDRYLSDLVLYEGERPIGPPHSYHVQIISLGGGRYSHWKGQGLLFSASDNSDPNRNGKLYSVRIRPPDP
jgi:hypothetical protein